MAYSKTTWVTGDVITAEKLNNIENKVEELDASSGDVEQVRTELTEQIEGVETELSGSIDALDDRVTQAEAAVGAPMVASTVAGMTDHTKVYVYTGSETGYTSGNWYYWDGSAWTSGGVYNSVAVDTDKTLSVANKAADGKKVGDELTELKSDLNDNKNAIFTGSYTYSVNWEAGTIQSGTSESSSTTRKRTGFLSFGETDTVHITVPNGKRIYGWYYSAQSMDSFVNSVRGGWHTESFDLTNDEEKYYRFTISDNPENESMVSESGFLFTANTYFNTLDKKIENDQAFIRANGRNLFNPNESVDKTSLSTSGATSTNSSYWTTGYIKVTGVAKLLIPTDQKLRYCWYSSSSPEGFISYGTEYNPLSVPDGANYIRVCYPKSAVAFEDRWQLYFTAYNSNPAFDNFSILNYKNISEQDNQHFYISGDYTETFSISVNRGSLGVKNQIVSYKGNYSGGAAPTIQFKFPYNHQTNLYTSQIYTMDEEIKQWRIPAFLDNATKMVITITITEGVTLSIKYLFNAYDNVINPSADGYKLWSHLGTGCIYPSNTTPAFNSAAALGYPGCVTVPKRTSDGVWVCFHDDSNVGNTLRMPDGSALPSADASKSISDFTYSQLMAYDAGIRINPFYAGEKVPTLESFFSLCQKTGMHPVLSVHPILSASEWAEIKTLTDKYNVTDKLSLKFGSVSNIADAYDIYGDTIESYCLVVSTARDAVQQMIDLGLTVNHATLGIEWTDNLISAANAANAISHGFWVGAFIQYGTAERYKEVMAMGVTEITDDNNCSFGLNW